MSLNRLVVAVAVAAVLWKLGDAPCGCAAHNGWIEAFAADGSHHDPHSHEHGESPEPFVDHGCSGPACPDYLSGDRIGIPNAESAVAAIPDAKVNIEPVVHLETARDVRVGPVDGGLTGKLRASLQILLI